MKIVALRRWKRDGSINLLSPIHAVRNLQYNGYHENLATLWFALQNGAVLHTKNATLCFSPMR
jgi:hypothetical protein